MSLLASLSIPTRIIYDIFSDKMAFEGVDIHMGLPILIIFNEQDQYHKGILMWNELLGKWMHSEDAGLTWTPYTDLSDDLLKRSSLVLSWKGERTYKKIDEVAGRILELDR